MRRFETNQLIPFTLIILLVLSIPTVIYLTFLESQNWEIFAEEHECQVIGQITGSINTGTGIGVTTTGDIGTVITTSYTPAKTGYLCNDGVTYWR